MESSDHTTVTTATTVTSPSSSSSPPPPPPQIISPCAACKLLRRRCIETCIFSPYFPPHDPLKFTAVHRVFGASNINKFLQELPEAQRADAASSMVYEANARLRDPVYGCAGAIYQLLKQVNDLQEQLAKSQAELVNMQRQNANQTLRAYVQSGFSKPPTSCGYTYIKGTPGGGLTVIDPDCARWSNDDRRRLCYGGVSCKEGALANLKKSWRRASVINIVMLMILGLVYVVVFMQDKTN